VLNRSLTIQAAEPPALGQLDFQYLLRKVLLAPNVTLRLDWLALSNVKKLGGYNLDFFMVRAPVCASGQASMRGCKMVARGGGGAQACAWHRPVCTPALTYAACTAPAAAPPRRVTPTPASW
jgi:hypothetical protein